MNNQPTPTHRTRTVISSCIIIGTLMGLLVLASGQVGCSTVSGFAQDLGSASDGIRDAMISQKEGE